MHDESLVLCPEVFWKRLLIVKVIINSDCFSNRFLKSAFEILSKKQLGFFFLYLDYHEQQSIFMANKESF